MAEDCKLDPKAGALFKKFIEEHRQKVDAELTSFIEGRIKSMGCEEGGFDNINCHAVRFANDFTKGGKRVRPGLLILGYLSFSKDGQVPPGLYKVAAGLEAFHAYLLIHDDVMDRDTTRRNMPTVWYRFKKELGVDTHTAYSLAITTGDIVNSWSKQLILGSGLDMDKIALALESMLKTEEDTGYGQNLDVYYTTLPIDEVTPEMVIEIHEFKTGKYTVAWPLTLGARLAGASDDVVGKLYEAGMKIGVAFQIQDDILGLIGDPRKTGKPRGSDVREGKRTYPIILAYQKAKEKGGREYELLSKALKQREDGLDEQTVEEVIKVIEGLGAIEEAKRHACRLASEAKELIVGIPMSQMTKEVLLDFADYTISREK